MPFTLPALPFAKDALSPYISAETLDYHHGKHHQAYVNKLNGLIEGTDWQDASLEAIIRGSEGGLFNNAAQIWNHSFYWQCLSGDFDQTPTGELATAIDQAFGSFENFKTQFTQTAMTTFGSGWAWLVKAKDTGALSIISTSNAGTPMTDENLIPLLTCDVWEHAYYVDTRNNRGQYVENFWHLCNWAFVAEQFKA